MFAKLLTGSIDPGRLQDATLAVRQQLIPGFAARDGALHGYWMADTASGQVVALGLWRDRESLDRAAVAEGVERTQVGERIGLRIHAIQALPVLAHTIDQPAETPTIRWVRLTWVDGIAERSRTRLSDLYGSIVEDQSSSNGFRASYWIGDQDAGEGCAISFWQRRSDLTVGATASRRRRRRVERDLGCRVGAVHHYQALGSTPGRPAASRRHDRDLGAASNDRPLAAHNG